MLFSRFCTQVQELLNDELPSAADIDFSDPDASACITVRTPADVLYPSIPLSRFYDAYLQGLSMNEIICRIISIYTVETLHPFCTASDFSSRHGFLKGLGFRPACLRLHRRNTSLLPHIIFHDMLFFFTAELPAENNVPGRSIVTREISNAFRMTDESLLKAAAAASKEHAPAVIFPLLLYLDKLIAEFPDAGDKIPAYFRSSSGSSFYVLTNPASHFGAAAILYSGMTAELYRRFGPYYLLPSSVHEILILPENDGVNRSELKQLIQSSNSSLCDSLLVLSDDLYYYEPHGGLRIC